MAVTITALLSTAIVASFRIGIRSWRQGEDFLGRSQRLSAAVELIQKQIGSANPLFPVSSLNAAGSFNKRLPDEFQDAPAFLGGPQDLIFVSNYPLTVLTPGGMQVIHYSVGVPAEARSSERAVATFMSAPSVGLEFRISAVPIFRREDFPRLAELTGQSSSNTLTLLGHIQEISFQYWGESAAAESKPPRESGPPVRPKLVPFDQWDASKRRRLPEAVSIRIRFAPMQENGVEKNPYNRESLRLLVPINTSKGD